MSVSVNVYRQHDLATTLWTCQPQPRFVSHRFARSGGLKLHLLGSVLVSGDILGRTVFEVFVKEEIEILDKEKKIDKERLNV